VAPGQTGITVTMNVENLHPSEALTLTTAGLTFTGTAVCTSEYTVTPDPANPTSIPVAGAVTLSFVVDVDSLATEETITVNGTIDATLATSGTPVTGNGADTPDQWDVVGARPEVRLVDAVATQVPQGASGEPVHLTVENVGLTDWVPGAIALSFVGTADHSSEYTVTADPANPTLVAAGATEILTALVDVSPTATAGVITIDVAQLDGSDVVTGRTQGDTGADVTDTWEVLSCSILLCGDCDLNGTLSILDALLAARVDAGLELSPPVGSQQFNHCNVSGVPFPDPGAIITILDALELARAAAGLITVTCC
jgi:hypothetical protein